MTESCRNDVVNGFPGHGQTLEGLWNMDRIAVIVRCRHPSLRQKHLKARTMRSTVECLGTLPHYTTIAALHVNECYLPLFDSNPKQNCNDVGEHDRNLV